MATLYFSKRMTDSIMLCLAPLTDRRLEMSGEHPPDTSGYFLYQQEGRGSRARISILAKVENDDAAYRLRDMLQLS